eukprot:TRINITY_DN21313_c0_g1_i1.p1 TRINITY_DN21313_c0_g1~~TRINITY_DN21313_c0_g1_i1.p1  ORF type:complete len:603 (-),score=80.10 TRINITY_DN21313_c0_g1_i1:47-1855(-)
MLAQSIPVWLMVACSSLGRVSVTSAAVQKDFCDWDRLDGRYLKPREFEKRYFEKKPILLTHLLDDWPALKDKRWSEKEMLASYGHYVFDSCHLSHHCLALSRLPKRNYTLEEYMNASSLSSWFISAFHPMVVDMKSKADFRVPDVLRSVTQSGPYVSIGRKGQGNIFHAHQTSWFAQVNGRKRWLVYKERAPNSSQLSSRLASEPCRSPPAWAGLTGCVTKPGDVIYLPSFYYHETCSLDDFNAGVAYIGGPFNNTLEIMKENKFEVTKLWQAAVQGKSKYLKRVLKNAKGADDVKQELLFAAIIHGHSATLKALWRSGAIINTSDGSPDSPDPALFVAVRSGHLAIVKTLIGLRVSLDQKDKDGLSAAHPAAEFGHLPILQYLTQHSKAVSVLQPRTGFHPLHIAASQGHISSVEWLLSSFEKSGSMKKPVSTPLHLAAEYDRADVARFLIQQRANVNDWDSDGLQPIHLAGKNGLGRSADVLELLLRSRASLESRDERGQVAAHMAASDGHLANLKLLVSRRAKLNRQDKEGWTPLMFAAGAGHVTTVQWLVDQDSAYDEVDSTSALAVTGEKALYIATQRGHNTVAELLRSPEKLRPEL